MAQQRSSRSSISRSDIFDNKSSLADPFDKTKGSIKPLLERYNIHDKLASGKMFDKFSRTRVIDPYNALFSTREYVFFTKPDLALVDTSSGSNISPVICGNKPFFIDAVDRYLPVIHQLQSSANGIDSIYRSPFMNMLSNSLTSTLDIPGSSAETIETVMP